MLHVNADSVTGRDDSLLGSLDFCYTKYLLFWVKVKRSLIFSLMRDLLKKSLNLLRFYSGSIICETLTILVLRTFDSGNQFTVPICLEKKLNVGQMFSSTYIVSLLVSISMDIQLYFLAKMVILY